jgi:exosome complex exonuclease RRP6
MENYDEEEGSGPGGWDTIARKWNKANFTKTADGSASKSIYLRIHDWRDRVAREEDESTAYVCQRETLSLLSLIIWNADTFYPSITYFNLRNSPRTTSWPS